MERRKWCSKDWGEEAARDRVEKFAIRNDQTRRHMICELIGCSRIVHERDGVLSCARCGNAHPKVSPHDVVVLEHEGCCHCSENRRNLTWRDTWEAPPLGQTDGRG